jgi:hypothetical protein
VFLRIWRPSIEIGAFVSSSSSVTKCKEEEEMEQYSEGTSRAGRADSM